MYSQVDISRSMLKLCTVKQTVVEQWQNYVESGRVKQSQGRVMQNQVESSEDMVVMQSQGRVTYSEVE